MAVARRNSRAISKCLNQLPQDWPFEDRVLAWLAPDLEREIVHFHGKNGASMDRIFQRHQIAHLDVDLRRQLYARIRAVSRVPGMRLPENA